MAENGIRDTLVVEPPNVRRPRAASTPLTHACRRPDANILEVARAALRPSRTRAARPDRQPGPDAGGPGRVAGLPRTARIEDVRQPRRAATGRFGGIPPAGQNEELSTSRRPAEHRTSPPIAGRSSKACFTLWDHYVKASDIVLRPLHVRALNHSTASPVDRLHSSTSSQYVPPGHLVGFPDLEPVQPQ